MTRNTKKNKLQNKNKIGGKIPSSFNGTTQSIISVTNNQSHAALKQLPQIGTVNTILKSTNVEKTIDTESELFDIYEQLIFPNINKIIMDDEKICDYYLTYMAKNSVIDDDFPEFSSPQKIYTE